MEDQNFDEQSISERVTQSSIAVFKVSAKNTSAKCSLANSPHKENHFNRNNIQTMIKDLYDQENFKKKSLGKSKKGWERGCDKKEVRLLQLREEKNKKELENCTFQPNGYKEYITRRSLGEFLEDQENFERRRHNKKMMLKEDLEEQEKHEFRPSIKNYPIDQTRRKDGSIFERLYQQRGKEREGVEVVVSKGLGRGSTQSRGKNNSSSKNFSSRLYDDAIRRQEQAKSDKNGPKQETQRTVNLINQRYVAQRFIKQLYSVIEEMDLDSTRLLDYLTFNELLYRLGFITGVEESDLKSTPQRALVYEAFTYLSQTQLSMKNICVFLLALIGIYYIDPVNFNGQQEEEEDLILNLTESEGRKIQKHFDLLYRNRLTAEDFKRATNKVPESQICTFKPEINPESGVMAENHRNKVMKETATIMGHYQISIPANANINHKDIEILNKIGKQKIREEIRMQQEQKQLQQCTFKPKTLHNKVKSSEKTSRCLELYNLHKRKMVKGKEQEKPEIPDTQCTFAPKIKNSRKSVKHVSNPRNSDKQILRMTECRKEKEEINKFLERGYDKTRVDWKQRGDQETRDPERRSRRESEPSIASETFDETPFLVVDVSLGSSTDSITVYRKDINKSGILADEFANKHGLDTDTKQKLRELLEQQINNVLQRIDEESNASENDG